MTVLGTMDAPLDQFGGLVTDMAPADLPAGVSPDCADVAFLPGAVKTRPGLLSVFTAIAGNPTINYLKTFAEQNLTKVLLALDSSGNLWGEFTQGTLTQINTGNGSFITAGSRGKSATLFGREYIALSDGKFGLDIPRQYDGNFFDRVSQCGVGAGPFSVFDAAAETALTVAAAPNGAVRDGNGKVTITTTTPHGYTAGQFAAIAGVTDGTLNGTFQITSVPSITTFTYAQTGAGSNSGAGTATMVPQISAGIHKVSVIFVTRQGYLTAPSPPVAWNSVGGRRVTLFGIPLALSDANVVARIVCFTVTGGASFYYTTGTNNTTNMVIPDNSTTNVTLDFSDTMLLAGTLADPLFNLIELGECAGVIGYADRLFWWGERNKLNNWLNLSFDGGWGAGGGAWPQNVPLGWKADPVFGLGTLRDFSAIWGGSLLIIGDGATATVGMILQSAVSDAFGVPRIAPNVSYSVRARIRAYPAGVPTAGSVQIHLFGTGVNTAGIQVAWNDTHLSTTFYEYTAVLTSGLSSIPSDLVLRVYGLNTISNGTGFGIDNIEIYPTARPYNASFVRASKDTDPESYDGVSGLIGVAVNDGTAVRAAFVLRNQLYFVKEHSIYSTQDDGVNEPADWTLSEISSAVGTFSADGVDIGEDWAAIADRSGLYIFDGGEPVKISQEIQPLWDQINWQYGHTLWVRVDTRNKRILVGVPIAPATQPNRILVLDYRGLSTAAEIASLGSVHASAYNGRLFAGGRARKWAPWNIAAKSAALVERADGTAQVFLGNGAGNGKIYQLSDSQLSDDGAAIPSYYTTYFFPSVDEEQSLQMRAHRKLFAYLTCYVEGAGNLSLSAFAANEAFATTLPTLVLSSPASKDLELTINVLAERAAFQVGTNQAGSWFRLARLVPSLQPDPWAPVRGGN